MARTPQDVTEAELGVLEALWESGKATIRQLTDRLYQTGSASQYATVQKLLERLEAKECVCRAKSGTSNAFSAMVTREELIGRRLQATAERLCGGSFMPLLTHLVQNRPLSSSDRRQLRELIEGLDDKGGKRQSRGPQ